jgi:hypothetical protein
MRRWVGMRRWVVRAGVTLLAAVNLGWGLWAVVTPESFFLTFPGFGHHWTAAYPPYNEHLVSDLGAIFLTLAVLLGIAAVLDERKVTLTVLAGVTVFNGLHVVFHLGHHGMLTGVDLVASLVVLGAGVAGPAVLMALPVPGAGGGGRPSPLVADRTTG